MRSRKKWVDFDKHPPAPEQFVYLRNDGTGQESGRMRIPCKYFSELREKYPKLKIFYRVRSTPKAGDEVRFQYPINNETDIGVVLSRDGEHLTIQADIAHGATIHTIEVDRYLSEVVVLADERFNETFGR